MTPKDFLVKEKVIIENFDLKKHGDSELWTTNEILEYMEGYAQYVNKESKNNIEEREQKFQDKLF